MSAAAQSAPVTEHVLTIRRFPEGDAAAQVGADDGVRGSGRDGLQPLLAGVAQQLEPVNLHPVHHQHSNVGQVLPVIVRERRARLRVGQAHGTDMVPVRGSQRDPRVEADVRVAVHQRAVAKARIGQGVGHAEDLPLRQRVVAEGDAAGGAGDIQPVAGCKKLPLVINQRNEGGGYAKKARGERGEAVQRVFRQRIRLLIGCQRREAGNLVV